MLELFITAFITLFVVTDPLSTAAVFVGMITNYDRDHARRIAYKASLVAFGVLVFFGLCGEALFQKLGISISSFRIAGGVLLFASAYQMVFGHNETEAIGREKENYTDHADLAVFPIAIPLLSGPGSITAIILLFSKAKSAEEWTVVFTALVAVMVGSLICLLAAHPIRTFFGKSGANVVARVMGIILAAMSVQFVLDGLAPYLR